MFPPGRRIAERCFRPRSRSPALRDSSHIVFLVINPLRGGIKDLCAATERRRSGASRLTGSRRGTTGDVARTEAPGGRTESEEQLLQVTAVVPGARGFTGLLLAKSKK